MIWYVHRRADHSIASAHAEPQPGYAEEALNDATDSEMIAYRAALTPAPLTPAQKLAAAGLSVADLKQLLGMK